MDASGGAGIQPRFFRLFPRELILKNEVKPRDICSGAKVYPDGRKELSRDAAPTPAPLPSQVVIPMVQHIGKPCTPLVKAGESVKLGQRSAMPKA